MRKAFASFLLLTLFAIATHTAAEEALGSGMSASRDDAVAKAQAMLEKRVVSACATKAKGGVAEGIAAPTCKVDQSSTGKWNAVCRVKFSCKNS